MPDDHPDDKIVATYLVETPHPLAKAAEILAGEQSSGTFVAVPGEDAALRLRHRAKVLQITPLDSVDHPSLPGSRPLAGAAPRYQRARVVISFPLDNMGVNLPVVLSTVAGNLFELAEFSGLRLLDVDFPPAFAEGYPGPQFAVAGTRKLTGVHDRPIIGTIVKPSVGLTPAQTARLVATLADAGIDFIKDDELMADPPHSPLAARVAAVMQAIDAHAQRTGKKVMYAFNITADLDAMRRHHDAVLAAGGTCVMISLNSLGLAAIADFRRHCRLPIHGHRNGWGMLTRHPALGLDFCAYQKFHRLAGVDHLHVNGLQSKFYESDDSVVASIQACRAPLLGGYPVLPVVSSGQWGGQAPLTYHRTGTLDLMYLAGGGILAHPGGPAAGVAAIRQAWEAAVAGQSLEQYSRTHRELAQAIEKFGGARP